MIGEMDDDHAALSAELVTRAALEKKV